MQKLSLDGQVEVNIGHNKTVRISQENSYITDLTMRVLLVLALLVAAASADWKWSTTGLMKKMQGMASKLGLYDDSDDSYTGEATDDGDVDRHHRPWFCHKLECPRYRRIKKFRGYELRCYEATMWAATGADQLDQRDFKPMFRRLYKYITGANKEKAKIDMTAPVLVGMYYNITDHKTKSVMSFYAPPTEKHHTPPEPTDEKVEIAKIPEFCVYVRSFGGWVMGRSRSMYKQLYYLSKDLKRDGHAYHKGVSFYAGYDSPWRLFRRHNEIWRVPKCHHHHHHCHNHTSEFMGVMHPNTNLVPEEIEEDEDEIKPSVIA